MKANPTAGGVREMPCRASVRSSRIRWGVLLMLALGVAASVTSLPSGGAPDSPIEEVKAAIVSIWIDGQCRATGFVISPAGYVLTNAHVVEDADVGSKIEIRSELPRLADGAPATLVDKIFRPARGQDLALLRIEDAGDDLPTVEFGNSGHVREGEEVTLISFPSAQDRACVHPAVTPGDVSALDMSLETDEGDSYRGLIELSSPARPGSSGGAVIDGSGEVIGIFVAGFRDPFPQLYYAIPSNIALGVGFVRESLPPYPPEITSLVFPVEPHQRLGKHEIYQGMEFQGQISFWDANQNMSAAFIKVPELEEADISVKVCCPPFSDKLSGEITFWIKLPVRDESQDLTLQVTLYDLDMKRSEPEVRRFTARLPKPQILDIDFPQEIQADGQKIPGSVEFADPNGDLRTARFTGEEGPFESFVLDVRGDTEEDRNFRRSVEGKERGLFHFRIAASEKGQVSVRVTLMDRTGLASEPKSFSFEANPSAARLEVSPESLEFRGLEGKRDPPDRPLTLSNRGGAPLTWTARTEADWLDVEPRRGTLPAHESAELQVSPSLAGLDAGTYSAHLEIAAPGAQNSPAVVRVILAVEQMRVCPSGCPFATVKEAINEADPRDTITIEPGTYPENLTITKALTLAGAGSQRSVIEGREPGRPVIRIESEEQIEVSIEGVAVSGASPWSSSRRCADRGNNLCPDGLQVAGKAKLTLSRSLLSEHADDGLDVRGEAAVMLASSRITDNAWYGLDVRGLADVDVMSSEVVGNHDLGIHLSDSASVRLEGSRVSGNGDHGIKVEDSARAALVNSEVSGNTINGLCLKGSAQVSLEDESHVAENGHDGVWVGSSAAIELSDSEITGNGANGLWIMGFAEAEITGGSRVSGNGEDGIRAESAGQIIVRGSRIESNGANSACLNKGPDHSVVCNGIQAAGQAKVSLTDVVISENADWGVTGWSRECGFEGDEFAGGVTFQGTNVIEGNNTSQNQDEMDNPGDDNPWNRPDVPDGQVCLP